MKNQATTKTKNRKGKHINTQKYKGFKLQNKVFKKKSEAKIDYVSRTECAIDLREYFKKERVRIEKLCPWYYWPFMQIAKEKIYRYYFLQIDNILNTGWETPEVKHDCKRYIPSAEMRLQQIKDAIEKDQKKKKKE